MINNKMSVLIMHKPSHKFSHKLNLITSGITSVIGAVLITLLSLLISNNACAKNGDETKPVQIDANQATLDQKAMVTVFTGNVVITRGTLVIHANQGVASQNPQGERTINLYGTPVYFSQMMDDNEKVEGQANQFEYNTKTNLAVLTGRARIRKVNNMVIGDKITYNTKTQIYSVSANNANGVNRVKSGRITVILDQNNNAITNK
jgi:lipopolysaccharide export system protein LptA